jgi:hypothetical protein
VQVKKLPLSRKAILLPTRTAQHAVGDKVESAYRRGDMLAKRHALMRDWERFCNGSVRD